MIESRPILLGQYRPLGSFLHRLDARAKILPVMLVLVLALLTDSFVFYIAILVSLLLGLLASRVALSTLVANFRPILILVVITLLYHVIFTARESAVVLDIVGFKLTAGALTAAAYFSLRLVLFVTVAFLVTLTSSPSELADAFTRLLRPLERLRVPVQDLALIMFLAIRFIPVLYEEFTTIRNAQIVRGVRFSGSVFNRVKKTLCIIIPVFVAAIQRADELALAIQARGYGRAGQRTFYSRSHFGAEEWLFAVGVSIFISALFYLTR